MYHHNRVVWGEGMFLRTQHFQQADRWAEHMVQASTRPLRPFPWGFCEAQLNREALGAGRIALVAARGIMPDGTPFDAPGNCDLPHPLELSEVNNGEIVYLTLPCRKAGEKEIETATDAAAQQRHARYGQIRYAAQDTNTDSFISADIEVARPRLQLRAARDPLAGFERLGLCRVSEVRADMAVTLDDAFIAPSLNCAAQQPLMGLVTELLALVSHRADAIAAGIGDPTLRGQAAIADFLLLQCLNRQETLLRHAYAQASSLHPEEFYRQCLSFAGDLAIFTRDLQRPVEFPAYRHDDLQMSFGHVFAELRAALTSIIDKTAVAIPLEERRRGVRVGVINDRPLLKSADFVLVVRADMPVERLHRAFPQQIKIGAVEKIAELVNVALRGIEIFPLAAAPHQLPRKQGAMYFQLDKSSTHWKQLEVSGAIALHLNGEFPALELELWAIKP
jgi:type VI secretion system protein ImpJ